MKERMELHMDGQLILNLTVPGQDTWPARGISMSTIMLPGTLYPTDTDACRNPSFERWKEFLIDYVIVRQYTNPGHTDKVIQISLGVALPLAAGASGILWLILLRLARQRRLKRTMSKCTLTTCTQSIPTVSAFEHAAEAADVLTNESVQAMEIPLANLQTTEIVLGRGATSVVRKGVVHELAGRSGPFAVAVKSVRNRSDAMENGQLVQELKIMTKVKWHPNIVRLVGVVLGGEALGFRELLLVFEYAKFGCLRYLLKSLGVECFYSHVSFDGVILPYDEDEAEKVRLLRKQTAPPTTSDEFDGQILSTRMLLQFAGQISQGMQYLSAFSIVHRDLAVRNILICDGYVAKISDFGMARQGTDCPDQDQKEALPVRWMPPEAITESLYSESDVWSFGVLLWEMFSLGALPYAGINVLPGHNISDFLASLQSGMRLHKPTLCPSAIYDLMCECWELSPEDRTDFTRLTHTLQTILDVACVPVHRV
ncbi:myoblast growth factor receptor egl-15-like [Paramacrobiotus metropolitanus]|uniref:myoblast growth factor receptor egl-15-like n=1 Tax=Paramacrobiotus metropolitanus TaxID=2943436 RepID=UPI002445D512|nr:myoblast growth factor receptor egl-15-like [Paramacrobiotus metropolitanus]